MKFGRYLLQYFSDFSSFRVMVTFQVNIEEKIWLVRKDFKIQIDPKKYFPLDLEASSQQGGCKKCVALDHQVLRGTGNLKCYLISISTS